MPERTLEQHCTILGYTEPQSQGRKSTAGWKFHFSKMFGAEDQHPESGELRLERYDGTEVHLPGPAVSAFASFCAETSRPSRLLLWELPSRGRWARISASLSERLSLAFWCREPDSVQTHVEAMHLICYIYNRNSALWTVLERNVCSQVRERNFWMLQMLWLEERREKENGWDMGHWSWSWLLSHQAWIEWFLMVFACIFCHFGKTEVISRSFPAK